MKAFETFDQRKKQRKAVAAGIFLLGTVFIIARGAWIYGRFHWDIFILEELVLFSLVWLLKSWLLAPIEAAEQEYTRKTKPWLDEYRAELDIAKITKPERDPSFREQYAQQNWREIVRNGERTREEVRNKMLKEKEKLSFYKSVNEKGAQEIVDSYLEPLRRLVKAMEYQAQGGAHKDRLKREQEEAEIVRLRKELLLLEGLIGEREE